MLSSGQWCRKFSIAVSSCMNCSWLWLWIYLNNEHTIVIKFNLLRRTFEAEHTILAKRYIYDSSGLLFDVKILIRISRNYKLADSNGLGVFISLRHRRRRRLSRTLYTKLKRFHTSNIRDPNYDIMSKTYSWSLSKFINKYNTESRLHLISQF